MYIGSDERIPRDSWLLVLNPDTKHQMRYTQVTWPEGAERLFLEPLWNAGDAIDRARRSNIPFGSIDIVMDRTTLSIRNGGPPIPVELHPDGMYVPEMIFGYLLSSSNYDKTVIKTGGGMNGIGVKCSNIFSKQFMVIIGDNIRKLKYTQVWNENMSVRGEPVIEPYEGESFVQIVYVLDFARFGYTEYPDEVFALYARHVADVSMTCRVPTTFNGVKLEVQDVRDYGALYFGEEIAKTAIVHREWPPGIEMVVKKGVPVPVDPTVSPIVEMCIMDTPDAGTNVSFVNAVMTSDGGVHVQAGLKALTGPLLDTINGTERKTKKKPTTTTTKEKEKPKIKLTQSDVQPHVSMIMSCRLPDPKFKAQTKTMLASPTPKIDIPEKTFQPVMKWQLIERLYAALEAKMYKTFTKTDGKKRRHILLEKGRDANEAGGQRSLECTLLIVEGKSAAGYAETMVSYIPDGRDTIGFLPIKGKMLNVMNANAIQIAENTEIAALKKMMGFREGVDYRLDENAATLRYGFIMIMTDADNDGNHIKGLILNLLHCRFPTFLARGSTLFYNTPILRYWKGAEVYKFYTDAEFEHWKREHLDWEKWEKKYFKGLGTSEDEHIQDDLNTKRIVSCLYDDQAPEALSLAFNEKRSADRKRWLAQWKKAIDIEVIQIQPISHFIHRELVQFSIVNTQRSIPRLMDGLKEGQRKLVWGGFLKWKSKSEDSHIVKNPTPMKVARFGGFVSENTGYHYGEKSLYDAVVGMAQNFVGANNLPYFQSRGQFGSREDGKPAADARYIFTALEWWIPYVYRKDDMSLLKIRCDEGDPIEPETLLPIIPMVLVNGILGIGTGHSTFIPNHNPLDLIAWIRAKITGTQSQKIIPWYRGFEGKIYLKPKGNGGENENPDETLPTEETETAPEPDGEPEEKKNVRVSMVTVGDFIVGHRGEVIVTELPIGRWTEKYRIWLNQLEEAKEISTFRDAGTKFKVRFEIKGFKNPNHQTLKLQKSYGMTNMVVLDLEGRPVKYNTVEEILEAFFEQRLPYYEQRRQNIIAQIDADIRKHEIDSRFIHAVNTNQLEIRNRKKADIITQMREMQLDPESLDRVKAGRFSQDEVAKLQMKIGKLVEKREAHERVSALQLWLADLDEFEAAYCKHFKCTPVPVQVNTPAVQLNVAPTVQLNVAPTPMPMKFNLVAV